MTAASFVFYNAIGAVAWVGLCLLGGVLFLAGMLLMAWNVMRTMAGWSTGSCLSFCIGYLLRTTNARQSGADAAGRAARRPISTTP